MVQVLVCLMCEKYHSAKTDNMCKLIVKTSNRKQDSLKQIHEPEILINIGNNNL